MLLMPGKLLRTQLSAWGFRLRDGARLMVGIPSYEAFFRDRQAARYGAGGKGGFRCC